MEWYYDKEVKEGRRKINDKLGRISIKNYEKDKEKIKKMGKKELLEFLEQY